MLCVWNCQWWCEAPTDKLDQTDCLACLSSVACFTKRTNAQLPYLQALSNQKLLEMRARFGHARCGLQTGDTSLNTEADVVIMTTEILRNIMYRTAEVEDAVKVGCVLWMCVMAVSLNELLVQY